MQIAPAKTLTFTHPTSGEILFSAPEPTLAQVEACIRLEPAAPEQGQGSVERQRRMFAQCVELLCPPLFSPDAPFACLAAWRRRRAARRWLRSLQYAQLVDLYRKLMLAVQGVDFESLEEFERALAAQKKSTDTARQSPVTTSSPGAAS